MRIHVHIFIYLRFILLSLLLKRVYKNGWKSVKEKQPLNNYYYVMFTVYPTSLG